VPGKTTDATRLLSGWHQDPKFIDDNALPRLLPESGPRASFEALFGRYGGDIAMPTMIKELLKTGAMERLASGEFKVLMRYYQPSLADSENLLFAVDRIHDVIQTMNNNVFVSESHTPQLRDLSPRATAMFRAFPLRPMEAAHLQVARQPSLA